MSVLVGVGSFLLRFVNILVKIGVMNNSMLIIVIIVMMNMMMG